MHITMTNWLIFIYRIYLWYDDKGKKNRCPAPQYIDYAMTYTQRTISDESYFPTKYAKGWNHTLAWLKTLILMDIY